MSVHRTRFVQHLSESLLALCAIVLGALSVPATATGQEAAEAARDSSAAADTTAPADSTNADAVDKFLEGFRLYGSLRVQGVTYEGATELQENGSRVGFRLTRDFFDSGIQVFGQVEFGIRLMQNFTNFNVSQNQSGLGRLEPGSREDAIYTRLGFVGFDFGDFGILQAGKQWSTYYDVAGYTDNFHVFGGSASGTYTLQSDGGGSGTGRADKTLSYRNRVGNFSLGAQAQLEANKFTGLGSVGGSAQYRFPFGLTLGVAGNYSDIPEVISESLLGAEDQGSAIVLGAKLERRRLFFAINYSIQDSHDARTVDSVTVAYGGHGVEAFGYYEISRRFRVSGGFNSFAPNALEPIDPDFRVRYGVLGGAYYLNSQTLVYAEWKIEDSVGPRGLRLPNVFALGVRLDFGLPEMQRNDAPPLRFPESAAESRSEESTD